MSDTEDLAFDNPLWRYGVELYGQPGVKDWLLGVQNRLAVDVNFVLLACWCSQYGLTLSLADWRDLSAITTPVRQNLIAPLRRQRRGLEGHCPPAVRRHLLQAELAAENALYARLWQWWRSTCPSPTLVALPQVERIGAMNLSVLADFYGVGRFADVEWMVAAACRQMAPQSTGDSEGRDGLPF